MRECNGHDVILRIGRQNPEDISIQNLPGPQDKINQSSGIIRSYLGKPLSGYQMRRINAERYIRAESHNRGNDIFRVDSITADGTQATQVIDRLVNKAGERSGLVHGSLLRTLNGILAPDCSFQRISALDVADQRSEVHLEDSSGRLIPLSGMGSGIKTILLVLLNTLVIPRLNHSIEPWRWVFAFEELENNLHPAILRRLIKYLCDHVETSRATLFITTHSTIVVDILTARKDAQIIHVRRNEESSTTSSVSCRNTQVQTLQDMGIRPSDVLLSNVVLWVEGPSDKTYLNKWIDLFSGGRLREFVHYQFIFLAGSLGAHYTFASSDPSEAEVNSLIEALRINHNAAMILDSDKRSEAWELKPHVKKLQQSKDKDVFFWLTDGREMENYIPPSVMKAYFGVDLAEDRKFESVFEATETIEGHKSWRDRKPEYAHRIVERPEYTKEALAGWLDLEARCSELVNQIAIWNDVRLPE